MKLLLDTHAFLWWLDDPLLLADAARIGIANPRHAVFVSAVCIQEIVLKQSRNRLTCPEPILPLIAVNRFSPLPITPEHAQAMRDLPLLHKDPFDRQLVAQCRVEDMTIVTRDGMLAEYVVPYWPHRKRGGTRQFAGRIKSGSGRHGRRATERGIPAATACPVS